MGGQFQESVEQELHAEIVRRAAEEHRGQRPAAHGVRIEVVARAVEHRQLIPRLLQRGRVHVGGDGGGLQPTDLLGGAVGALGRAFVEV